MPEEAKNLDEVLASWDESKEGKSEIAEMKARMTKLEEENVSLKAGEETRKTADAKAEEQAAYAEDIKPVLEALRKDGFKASDLATERWINAEAISNKRLAKAWDNRSEDSEAFDKMIEELAPKFQADAKQEAKGVLDVKDEPTPEEKTTAGDKAAARATRIARSSNAVVDDDYTNVDWGGLSGADFARMSNKVYADMRDGTLKPE